MQIRPANEINAEYFCGKPIKKSALKQGWKALMLITGMHLLAGLAWAGQTNYAIGNAAAAELRLGLGARPAGMGEAFSSLADDANAVTWNPAGLGKVAGAQAGFMHYLYLADMYFDHVNYSQNLMPGAGFGAAFTYYNFGTFDKLDESGLNSGAFTPVTFVLTGGYGQNILPGLYVGLAAKILQEQIDADKYSALGADLGVQWQAPGEVKTAFVIQNLGTNLAESPLSRQIKIGLARSIPLGIRSGDLWQAALDVNWPVADAQYTSVNLGTEYWFQNSFALRLGYKWKNQSEVSGTAGLCAGLGVKYSILSLDYALVSVGSLGLTHQVAAGIGF